MDVSIIIPTCNRGESLRNTIEAICRQTFPAQNFELIIADKRSTDNTKKVVEDAQKNNPEHNIVYLYEAVPGSLAARHCAYHASRTDNILIFTDDDVLPENNWLQTVVEAFATDNKLQMLGGPSEPLYEGERPEWFLKMFPMSLDKPICIPQYSLLDLHCKTPVEVNPNLIWSLNLAIRKSAFERCQGLHLCVMPREYMHFQGDGETGLTRRVEDLQLKTMYHPQMRLKHIIPASRLTVGFLDSWYYYSGISDSYSNYRASNNLYINHASFKQRIINNLNSFGIDLRTIMDKVDANQNDFELRLLYARCHYNFQSGYQFHRWAVKHSKALQKWVLKENYFDYKFPEL